MKSTRPVAIVTGASRGIGAGLVEGYRGRGYCVVATSRSNRCTEGRSSAVLASAASCRA